MPNNKFHHLQPNREIGNYMWNDQAKLGEGAFGKVFYGKRKGNGAVVAIKEMDMNNLRDPGL